VLYPIKQLNHFPVNDTVTVHCSFTYTTPVPDCCLTGLLASVILCQQFRHLNASPYNLSYLSPTVLNVRWQIKPTTYGCEPSVTDASKPKKQIYQKVFGYTLVYLVCLFPWASVASHWLFVPPTLDVPTFWPPVAPAPTDAFRTPAAEIGT
jgi:hypothetical protein